MALLNNGAFLYSNTNRYFSAIGAHAILSAVGAGAAKRNWNAGWHTITDVTNRSALPDGYRPPSCWMMAQKTGGLSSRSEANFTVTAASASIAAGRNIVGSDTFAFTVPAADLTLLFYATGTTDITFTESGTITGLAVLEASESFSVTVSSPLLGGLLSAAANPVSVTFTAAATSSALGQLTGAPSVAFTVPAADMELIASAAGTTSITFTESGVAVAALSAIGSSSFSVTVSDATLGAVIDAVATSSITFTGAATPYAIGNLAGDITPFSGAVTNESIEATIKPLLVVVNDNVKKASLLIPATADL